MLPRQALKNTNHKKAIYHNETRNQQRQESSLIQQEILEATANNVKDLDPPNAENTEQSSGPEWGCGTARAVCGKGGCAPCFRHFSGLEQSRGPNAAVRLQGLCVGKGAVLENTEQSRGPESGCGTARAVCGKGFRQFGLLKMPKTRSGQGGQAKAIPELLHQTPFVPEPRVAAVGMYSSCDKPAVMDTVLTCRAYANTCCAYVFLVVVRCPEKSLPYTEPDQGTNDQVQAESTDF